MNWLILALAGALGTLARVGLSTCVQRSVLSSFPWGVTAVNLTGSLLFGFLGAFTTFSTLMFETVRLMQGGQMFSALALLTIHNVLGLLVFWLGMQSVPLLFGKVFQ